MMSELDVAVQAALQDLIDEKYPSIRAAAAAYSLTYSTLWNRVNHRPNRRESHADQQLLSPIQENRLVLWILDLEQQGHAPTHAQLREMALKISIQSGGPSQIGTNWIQRFIRRHSSISTKIGRRMDALRVQSANPTDLRAWYHGFQALVQKEKVNIADIWNMDETGLTLGLVNANGRVLGTSRTKRTYKKAPGASREWVTTIETISASGETIQPLVIFKGRSLQTSWFKRDSVPDWHYTTSENAYTTNSIGLQWLKEIFLPATVRNPPRPRILILDNQGSHITTDFLWECYINNVYLYFLIPHTSHVCQPLDLCPFSIIKSIYKKQIQALSQYDNADKIKKIRFIETYANARTEGLSSRNIKAGWRGAGLEPWNPDKALSSSLILQAADSPQHPPQDPPLTPTKTSNPKFPTPRNRRQIQQAVRRISTQETLSRPVRTLFRQLSKFADESNQNEAVCLAQIAGQKRKIEEIQGSKRQKIRISAQNRFADIVAIKKAQDQEREDTEQGEAHAERIGRAMARRTANQMINRDIESCITVWQI